MARIRTIKPSFFRSEDVSVLPLRARLTWIGLWTHCDDSGRAKDNARLIKGDIWPLDEVSLRDIEEDLATLAGHGRIVRYEVDGKRYLEIANWRDHQAIQKPTPSKIPAPTMMSVNSGNPPVVLPDPDSSPFPRKGKEGKGEEGTRASAQEPRPPTQCRDHQDDPDPPACRRCRTAREAAEAWDATYAVSHAMADARGRDTRPQCPRHPGQLAHNCGLCRAERLGGVDD